MSGAFRAPLVQGPLPCTTWRPLPLPRVRWFAADGIIYGIVLVHMLHIGGRGFGIRRRLHARGANQPRLSENVVSQNFGLLGKFAPYLGRCAAVSLQGLPTFGFHETSS